MEKLVCILDKLASHSPAYLVGYLLPALLIGFFISLVFKNKRLIITCIVACFTIGLSIYGNTARTIDEFEHGIEDAVKNLPVRISDYEEIIDIEYFRENKLLKYEIQYSSILNSEQFAKQDPVLIELYNRKIIDSICLLYGKQIQCSGLNVSYEYYDARNVKIFSRNVDECN